jgi:hypothetical protein
MDASSRSAAETGLTAAAQARGLADPRPPYRELLRRLREADRPTFDRAIEHYDSSVLPALAGSDPVAAWVEYGRYLAALEGPGRTVHIDAVGRGTDWTPQAPPGLVLFLPDDNSANALVLSAPETPSAAQQAALTLLVDRKLSG